MVAGEAMAWNGVTHAFVYANGSYTDIGSLAGFPESQATAINEDGAVVGFATYDPGVFVGSPVNRAFVYQNGVLADLNDLISTPGWTLLRAYDINDRGQIVGQGMYQNHYRAFLLTPSEVPEPGAWGLLLGIGATTLFSLFRSGSRRFRWSTATGAAASSAAACGWRERR